MPRLQLKWMAALALLAGGVLVISGALLERHLEARLLAQREAELLNRADQLGLWLRDQEWRDAAPEPLYQLVRQAARIASGRVTVMAADGTVLADSEVPLAELPRVENHAGRPEMRAALSGAAGTSVRRSVTVGRRLLYGAVPLPGASAARPSGTDGSADAAGAAAPGAVVRLALDLNAIEAALSALRVEFAIAGGVGLALAVGLSFLLSGVLLRPLGLIRRTVRRIARGELTARVDLGSRDAFGEVARAIDRMGAELEERVAQLTGEKEQLHAVLRAMVEGVLVLGPEGRVELANRRLRELFEVRGDVEDRSPIEVIRHADVQEALERARASARPVVLEIETAGRSPRVLRMHAVALRGELRDGVVAVFHDITEIRRLESVRRDFVANASHELKTPLTAIRGFAETLVRSTVGPAERGRYLAIILSHSERLGALVDDLLELSRIESSATGPSASEVLELGPLVEGGLRSLDALFSSRDLSLELGPLDVPPVRAEPQAVERVLFSLLDNAAKYTEPGGKIWVRAECEEGFVRVLIQDTGIGISRVHQQRIFERFYRVDRARSREAGGTGLGLAIVRHWVERLGGRVGVESEPGVGSTFWFTLPSAS